MDLCLLCLELRNASEECIKVQSKIWQEENIEKLIEIHFWTMKTFNDTSWLCTSCWQILREFHKFYVRIENAHDFLTSTLKTEMQDIVEFDSQQCADNNADTIGQRSNEISNNLEINMNTDTVCPAIEIISVNEEEKLLNIKSESINEDPLEEIKDNVCKENEKQMETRSKHCKNSLKKSSCRDKQMEKRRLHKKIKESNKRKRHKVEEPSTEDFSDLEEENQFQNRTEYRAEDEFLSQNFQINCGICQSTQKTYHELRKHSAMEHQQPGYTVCCGKSFHKRCLLVDHIHWHLDPDYFKCNECGKVMADRRCLKQHARVHEKLERTHTCDECGKAFARALALRRHKLIHLPDDQRKYTCDECGKNFGSNNLLMNHVRAVHQNKSSLVCDMCGRRMYSKDVFERHMKQHKGQPIPTLSCDICGLKMTSQRGLKSHREVQHPENGKRIEYKCHVCSKISPTLKAHKKHVRYQHELGFMYKCTVCEKQFKRAIALTEHMATHTGTVLYTCPDCPKTFNSSGNMYNHRKKSHPLEWLEACRAKYSGNLPPNFKPLK